MLLDTIERHIGAADEPPRGSVIVLHGLGADATDFLPIASELDLSGVEPLRFLFPNAPPRAVTVNGGYVMRAWYDILGVDFTRRGEDETGLRASQAAIVALLEREESRGVPAERIVLGGFSQGCAMALLTGLRYRRRLGGIIGLSGYLPLAAQTAAERSAANARTPVFLAHGQQDGVVPLVAGVASRDLLQGLEQPVEWHEYPMAHAVCAAELADLQRWLRRVLA
jgi:phospholipase/carboxylesterase